MTILLVPLLFVFLVKKNMSPGIYPLLLEETVWGPGRGETHCLHPQQDQDSGPVAWAPAGSKRIGPQLETCPAFHFWLWDSGLHPPQSCLLAVPVGSTHECCRGWVPSWACTLPTPTPSTRHVLLQVSTRPPLPDEGLRFQEAGCLPRRWGHIQQSCVPGRNDLDLPPGCGNTRLAFLISLSPSESLHRGF